MSTIWYWIKFNINITLLELWNLGFQYGKVTMSLVFLLKRATVMHMSMPLVYRTARSIIMFCLMLYATHRRDVAKWWRRESSACIEHSGAPRQQSILPIATTALLGNFLDNCLVFWAFTIIWSNIFALFCKSHFIRKKLRHHASQTVN